MTVINFLEFVDIKTFYFLWGGECDRASPPSILMTMNKNIHFYRRVMVIFTFHQRTLLVNPQN
jgi:hypothetical protein